MNYHMVMEQYLRKEWYPFPHYASRLNLTMPLAMHTLSN